MNASTRREVLEFPASDPAATKTGRQSLVHLEGVSYCYGRVDALRSIDLEIFAGDFCALLGPSGSGKTTLLRLIGGFLRPSDGVIRIAGADITGLPPEKRPTNMVFQGYGLFPHMDVRQNISYGLVIRTVPRPDAERKVARVMELLHIEDLARRSVHQLSGGQQQRVALARALVMEPTVLLLDEPLAALDLQLRKRMQEELRRIHKEINGTFIFVTHDQGEAMALANRIAVMDRGRMVQIGSPRDVYCNPGTSFVSTFIGDANLFPGERKASWVTIRDSVRFADNGPDAQVLVVVRPDAMTLTSQAPPDRPSIFGTIGDVLFLGPCTQYVVQLETGTDRLIVQDYGSAGQEYSIGDPVYVTWRSDAQRVVSVP